MLMLAILLQAGSTNECYSAGGDQEIAQCWLVAFDKADKELNRVWPDALKAARQADRAFVPNQRRGKPGAAADLLDSQRAWAKFRDPECAAESDYAQGGSLQNIIAGQCSTELTRERIKKLRDIAAGFREG